MDKLYQLVSEQRDEEAAAMVTAFSGDMNNHRSLTLLYAAVDFYCPLTIAALGARGDCNPNSAGWSHNFPLHAASHSLTLLGLLISRFPTLDFNVRNFYGLVVLHHVASYGYEVRLLLDAGADPTIKTLCGQTPEQLARVNNHHKIANMLASAAEPVAGMKAHKT